MGLFDKFRRKPPEDPSADQLFAMLAEAVAAADGPGFARICQDHTEAIADAFPRWQKPGKQPDPDAMQTIIDVLGHTARYFDEALGRPELWAALVGPRDDNPFERWAAAQRRAMQRVEVIDHEGAIEQTRALLDDLSNFSGPARDEQEELTRGLLGQLLRQVGRPDEAESQLEWTLARCEARGDDEGVGIYLRELHEADRDRGRPSRWRLRLAEHARKCGDDELAAWLRAVEQRFPAGEPLLRMIVQIEGRRFELDGRYHELLREGGKADVLFERNRQTLRPAMQWIERGREHGGRGEHDNAVTCFVAAAEADPHDPESRYLQAFALMLLDRPNLALSLYDQVEQLAPGWYHSRMWSSLAQRRLDGTLAHETVQLIHTLEDGELSPEARLQVTAQALLRWPRVPELHLIRGHALEQLGRDAEHAWLAGLEVCADISSTRSRLLLALGRLEEVLEIENANMMAVAAATMQLHLRTCEQ